MIDISAALRAYLLTVPSVTVLTGQRIWAERDVPPAGYKPTDGGAIAFKVRGGTLDYPSVHAQPSVQFKCYAGDEASANTVYLALVDALQDIRAWPIRHAEVEVLGQTLDEPETLWTFVLAYFRLILANQ